MPKLQIVVQVFSIFVDNFEKAANVEPLFPI